MSSSSAILLAEDSSSSCFASAAELTPIEAISAPASYKVIYVFSDDQDKHEGRLKVGDTTVHTSKHFSEITQEELEAAARKRIDSYTKTVEVSYELEHVELAVRPIVEQRADAEPTQWESFRDYEVHSVLMRSGHEKKFARKDKHNGEWFETSVAVVQEAIKAAKAHEHFLSADAGVSSIVLRPEQAEAVKKTKKCFKGASLETPRRMLWNAKMRFGKTLTAYSLVRELAEQNACRKVLIITHRPDVNDSWWEDFKKIGLPAGGWAYGSKRNSLAWEDVAHNDKFFWFASIQDLRGSHKAGSMSEGDFEELTKNEALFSTDWDLVITDEAHEGTLTELAKRMFGALKSKSFLDLSGTPFNIINAEAWDDEQLAARFAYDDRYHWSYPDERRAKRAWEEAHGDSSDNPYAALPEVRFITYDVSDAIGALKDGELSGKYGGISFTELFKTSVMGGRRKFVHEAQVEDLLHKMQGMGKYSSDPSLFPYHKNFANYFNHTLWMLPNVAACEAMEDLLNLHSSGFSGFKVVNATGLGGDTWDGDKSALQAVRKAIGSSKNTITLSQQMLTTGVTVTPWTAVFMLNNVTSPMLYMQTAFRAASPGSLPDGRSKDQAYVFDFNPDRCLREIVEVAKVNAEEATNGDPVEQATKDSASVNEYLEYISVLSLTGSKFIAPDSDSIMAQLNEAYISEVVEKGFDSPKLWNNKQLQKFDIEKIKVLEALRKLQGGKDVDSTNGLMPITELTPDERAKLVELKAKELGDPPEELTAEETEAKKAIEQKGEVAKKQERKNRQNAVSILAGVAARLPMLVYASPAEESISPENFAELIDDESWQEFMPKNLVRITPPDAKSLEERQEEAFGAEGNILYWDDVRRFFDPVIFSLSCERIRRTAREIDEKLPLERAFRTAALFANFKNPDKETVLTPFRVVTMQYAHTLGGLQFIDLERSTAEHVLAYTRNIETGELESRSMKQTIILLDVGTHELAPVWKTSSVDPVQNDQKDFWEDPETTIFDINSKTALYPLYAAASLFHEGKRNYEQSSGLELDASQERELWQEIIKYQIFVNCRVDYSARIAQRVLAGYNNYTVNSSTVDVLMLKAKLKSFQLVRSGDSGVSKKAKSLTRHEESLIWNSIFSKKTFKDKSTTTLFKDILLASNRDIEELLRGLEEPDKSNFTAVVSNPPYQMAWGSGNSSAVYHYFMEIAQDLGVKYISMVYQSRWRIGGVGAGLDEFKNRELKSKHYVKYIDVLGKEFFPSSDTGPLNYFLWTNEPSHIVKWNHYGDEFEVTTLHDSSLVVRLKDLKIVSKIGFTESPLADIVTGQTFYGTNTDSLKSVKAFEDKEGELIFIRSNSGSGLERVRVSKEITKAKVDDYKVFVTRKANRRTEGELVRSDRIFVGRPYEVRGRFLLNVGSFSTEDEARNCLLYLKTEFSTYLLGVRVPSTDVAPDRYLFVPCLNFVTGEILDKPGTFLDFSNPKTLDQQLAAIYELTEEEQELMRKDLKPWKDKVDVEADK